MALEGIEPEAQAVAKDCSTSTRAAASATNVLDVPLRLTKICIPLAEEFSTQANAREAGNATCDRMLGMACCGVQTYASDHHRLNVVTTEHSN